MASIVFWFGWTRCFSACFVRKHFNWKMSADRFSFESCVWAISLLPVNSMGMRERERNEKSNEQESHTINSVTIQLIEKCTYDTNSFNLHALWRWLRQYVSNVHLNLRYSFLYFRMHNGFLLILMKLTAMYRTIFWNHRF